MELPFKTRFKSPTQARRALPFRPLPASGMAKIFQSILNQPAQNPERLLYIHIPFCSKTCSFCIYNRYANLPEHIITSYVETIINQIRSAAKTPWVQAAPFKAVYFGGGTPTAIPSKDLVRIVDSINLYIPLANGCEITVESTISNISSSLVKSLAEAGVNRISLGVQTFDNTIRESLGRESNRETIATKIRTISQGGISNICIDLIYGLPNQTIESWTADLEIVQQLPITGCSVYPLVSKPNGQGTSTEIDIDLEYKLFAAAHTTLNSIDGWQQFTPVQYGHSTYGKAIYVSGHGQNADMLALGAGAGGRINTHTYFTNPNVEEFLECKANFAQTPKIMMSIDKEFLNLSKVFTLSEGLRLSKQHYQKLKGIFGSDFDYLKEQGLIFEINESLQLSPTGCFWAANISDVFAQRIGKVLQGDTANH
jgi:oxygen-independent coproporphyrinogen-3 oxidase